MLGWRFEGLVASADATQVHLWDLTNHQTTSCVVSGGVESWVASDHKIATNTSNNRIIQSMAGGHARLSQRLKSSLNHLGLPKVESKIPRPMVSDACVHVLSCGNNKSISTLTYAKHQSALLLGWKSSVGGGSGVKGFDLRTNQSCLEWSLEPKLSKSTHSGEIGYPSSVWAGVDGGSPSSSSSSSSSSCLSNEDTNDVIVATSNGYLTQFDKRSGKVLLQWRGHTSPINKVLKQNNQVIATSVDRSISLWNIRSSSPVASVTLSHRYTGLPSAPAPPVIFKDTIMTAVGAKVGLASLQNPTDRVSLTSVKYASNRTPLKGNIISMLPLPHFSFSSVGMGVGGGGGGGGGIVALGTDDGKLLFCS